MKIMAEQTFSVLGRTTEPFGKLNLLSFIKKSVGLSWAVMIK